MGNTANLELPYMENTDPLANVAAAMQALANAIDTKTAAAWTAYTPTFTNLNVGNGIVIARYLKIGKRLLLRWDVAGGTTTSASGGISMSLPPGGLAAHGSGRQYLPAIGSGMLGGLLVNPGASTASWLTNTGAQISTFGNGNGFVGHGMIELA